MAALLLVVEVEAQAGAVSPVVGEEAPAFADILKIDMHAHVFGDLPELNELFRRYNIRTLNQCDTRGAAGEQLEIRHRIVLELFRAHPDLYPFASTFDLTRRDQPGYAEEVIAWLDQTFRNGAVAVKIWKEIGMGLSRPDGSFLMPDDPLFDPIYAHLAKRGKPLLAHLGDPIDAWLPFERMGVYRRYFTHNPEWHVYGKPGYPSHADLMTARERILEKHPALIFIGAHLGSLEHDLEAIARQLDRYPNFYVECGGRTRDLTYHPPEKVRAFLIQYQDRVMYGIDASWRPLQGSPPTDIMRRAYVTRVEQRHRSDYSYYSGTGEIEYEGRTVQALGLPRSVLEKYYHRNVRRLVLER